MLQQLLVLQKYLAPSALQFFYCFIAACLIALSWTKEQLSQVLIPNGSEESITTLQELMKQFVDKYTNNEFIGMLSVAFIWAVFGIIVLAVVYETVNIFIALRNQKIIATTFTHTEENKKQFHEAAMGKALLVAGFAGFVIIVITILFPFFHNLISQPADDFFQLKNIMKELIGIIGLTFTLALVWRGCLAILPKFT